MMQWVLDNWLILLFGGAMIAMHLFGHGNHGKVGDGAKSRRANATSNTDDTGGSS